MKAQARIKVKTEVHKLRAFEDYLVLIVENPPEGIGIIMKKVNDLEH